LIWGLLFGEVAAREVIRGGFSGVRDGFFRVAREGLFPGKSLGITQAGLILLSVRLGLRGFSWVIKPPVSEDPPVVAPPNTRRKPILRGEAALGRSIDLAL